MAKPFVKLDLHDRVARVILDRPEHDNRFTTDMMLALIQQLQTAKTKADFLIVESTGDDFTLGRDQSEQPSQTTKEDSLALILEANRLLQEFQGLSIAVVKGRALGFGSGLVVQSDLAITGESSVFGFDEVSHGFPPMIVMTYLNDNLLRKHVIELVLTGRLISAVEALTLGIVTRVVPDGQLDTSVKELVTELKQLDIAAVRRGKRYLREIRDVEIAERPAYALREQVAWMKSSA